MMSIKLPWLLRCPTVRVAWLFLVVWVATGLDIGCNNITSPSLLLNVTTAPSVRILNCTRRIAVNVTCGMDKDHLMRVEVVGGTTVPVFNLVSCSISGVLSFSFATLSIRNVTMPTGPANALDLQSNPLFSTLSVFTLSITVVDSQLQWTSGYLISCNGPSSNLRDLNVSIANSSLESRIADASSGGVLFVSVANIQSIGVVIMSCSIFVAQTSNTAKGMIRLGTDSGDAISIAMIDSVMSVLSEGFGNCNCVMLTYSQNIGYLSRTSVLVSGSNFTAKSQVGFAVVTIPFQRQLSLTDSRFDIVRCQLGVTLNVIDLSTDLGSPIASPFSCVAISLENIIVTVLGVNMSVVRNITGALRSVSSSGTSILGFIGLTYFSTNVSMSTVEVTRSTLTIEEVGAELVLPYQPVAVLGFAFATVSYSLHFSAAASFVKSNITILNSSITALRSVVDDAVLVASPGVQSGILFWSLTAVALSGPTVQTHISVKTTGITAATLAYPSQSPASLKVWCVVAAISNVAPNTAFAADQSSYLAFSGQLSLNFTSLDVNNSLFEITDTTMQLSPPFYSQLATPVTAAQQRVLFGMVAMSNVVNTTVLVTKSRFCNITESLTTTVTYDSTVCLAWVSLAPTSTIDNLLISLSHADGAAPVTSSFLSLMCASGSTVFRNSRYIIENSTLQAPARQVGDSWDAIRLAPTSPNFKTTLQLDNASVYLRNTSFTNFRSLFGNATIPLRSPTSVNNVALALSPLHLAVFSCASNLWDNAPLMKYSDQLLRPTTADSSTANYSLLTMHVDEGSDWCTLPPSAAPTPIPTSTTYSDLMAMTHRSSTATTAVLSASLLSTSSVGASVVPRLQGIVGTFRIAARCQLASGASSQSNDEEVSSGYVANDVLDNPLMLRLVPVAPSLAYAVGALIGNTLLFIAVGVVSHLLGVAKHHAIKTVKGVRNGRRDLLGADTMRVQNRKRVLGESDDRTSLNRYSAEMFLVASEVLPTVPLPASLMLLYGLLQEPTMVAALASVAYHERDAVSVVVGVVMGLCWIALPYVFLWLLLVKHAPLPLQTISAGRVHSKRLRWQRSGRALEWLCAERERWVVGSGRRSTTRDTARQVNRRLGALVRAVSYRRRWYFGIDALLGGLTGIVIGAAESVSNGDACDAAVWGTACVGAIGAASCVLCAWLRPFVVRVEFFSAFVVSFLSVIASMLMLAGEANSAGVVSLLASAVPLVSIVAGYAWRACCLPHDAEQRANAGAATSRGNERTTQKLSLGQMEALKGLLECICNSA